MLKLMALCDFL